MNELEVVSKQNEVSLDLFVPRFYQTPVLDAIENRGYRNMIAILPRRAGKDVAAFNLAIRECLRKRCLIYYVYPSYKQAKKAIWDGITSESLRFLDFIPTDLVYKINQQEMKITFKNGSILQLVGSTDYDALRGTNPQGVVFSEYSRQDSRVYTDVISPILDANRGWALFISTPFGKNHFWDLYQMALTNPNWFVLLLTLDDTKHIPLEAIQERRKTLSEDMIQQEYYCSFTLGVEGSYYAKYIEDLKLKEQIGKVIWDPSKKVHTAWDLGVADSTAIIFIQLVGNAIHVIDYYEHSKEGLEHYIKVLQSKPYQYGRHIAPFDIQVREFTTGMTRLEKARALGISFIVAPNVSIMDGIEAVRTTLPRMCIDEITCAPLIKHLENYRQEFDEKRKVYKSSPLHDNSSHAADAARYLCLSLNKLQDGLTPEELDRRYQQAINGPQGGLPKFFQDTKYNY
jgi:phage terminase large subunit